ncbi:MAG TPA: sugar ABC transporter permease, partial [Pseudonocardiaceae bacterium]
MATISANDTVPVVRAEQPAPRPRRRISSKGRRHPLLAWLFISPALVGFGTFFAYPTFRGIYLSFTTFHVLSPPKWIGLGNFRELLHDDTFWHSLIVTVYFVVLSVVFGILISLVTAVIMHRLTRSTVLRGLILLPFLISGVVA